MLSLKLPRLLNMHQVPKGILFGYRHPKSSAADCLVSVFQMTNETVNIWTHFLPSWYFLWKLLAFLSARDVWSDRYTWPFLAYLATCCVYPLASSFAHTFSSMSSRARHICYFFDYGALAAYSLGEAKMQRQQLYLCEASGCHESVVPVHYRHTALALLTCFLFATHLPERLAPGLFDYVGHSHQLFHVCGIVGTHFQMEALLADMAQRREWLLAALPAPAFSQTLGPVLASTAVNLLLIAAFSMTLYSVPKFSRRKSKHRRD
ncbi:hypothetical protein JD844_014750 [Phrynosoma platyrhinos]|uniref:Membrane progestin receptor gamma n=1 Tax=Phrynosoma platyrhinos TaxID=52577 RepID=A0ABQ7SRZ7_PHRPL|nr:hypothetical protein JD844_014750 [Phrynosoma platyrhinos]